MTVIRRFARVLALGVVLAASGASGACGGRPPPPTRGVSEAAISDWEFRRFQEVLDIEVWVSENHAKAFAGTYVRAAAERAGRLGDDDVVNVFVTRYEKDDGVLRATVKFLRRLAQESGYQLEEDKVEGVRLVKISGNGETWAMWSSRGHVVKVGGRGRSGVPDQMVEWYGERYPSTFPSGVLEGPLPAGTDEPKPENEEPGEGEPDFEQYDKDKVELPSTKK
ncbi:MAG TPA: hypothetical protein VM261_22865 [Kofleriaceae bacterium]|nr:hypothetical protein [Kofleriaceae bacterium]